ncbi:hypothetical protein, conserved [Babesia ovata]|uniref:Uncharacterized protein n=1 Tax=Babesia ovata TaxID=189622 RepID=A0A2H6KF61_9APIC|nr:uncharacterized protein BOVATA_031310 [Babesia ovata]GBE61638.1 hypothetical protein, conserved [Babesia ovata]
MAYNSLTEAPHDLKEGIDWLMALKGADAGKNLAAMGVAVHDLLADGPVASGVLPALESVRRISKEFVEQPELKDMWPTNELVEMFNRSINRKLGNNSTLLRGIDDNDKKDIEARDFIAETIANDLGDVLQTTEKFLGDIKDPAHYMPAYSSEATWDASCAKDPEACAVVLVGIAPMLYAGVFTLWTVINGDFFIDETPVGVEDLGNVMKALGFVEPEYRTSQSRRNLLHALRGMHKTLLATMYDLSGFWDSDTLDSLEPTDVISEEPKKVESVEPTEVESEEPKEVESVEPTEVESEEPKKVESVEPTEVESEEPKEVESVEPTEVESVEPTEVESEEPKEVESVEPTEVESVEPTEVESEEPKEVESVEPTEVESEEPKEVESVEPTEVESVEPTEVESEEPKEVESEEPKEVESEKPKDGKSEEPKDAKSEEPRDGKSEKPKDGKSEEPKDAKSEEPRDGKSEEPKEVESEKPKDGKSEEPKDAKSEEPKDAKSEEPRDGKSEKPKDGKSEKPKDAKSEEPKDAKAGKAKKCPKVKRWFMSCFCI